MIVPISTSDKSLKIFFVSVFNFLSLTFFHFDDQEPFSLNLARSLHSYCKFFVRKDTLLIFVITFFKTPNEVYFCDHINEIVHFIDIV